MISKTTMKNSSFKPVSKASMVLGMLLVSGYSYAQSINMDFSNEYNATSIHAQGDAYFIDKVKELTDGDIGITLHTGEH